MVGNISDEDGAEGGSVRSTSELFDFYNDLLIFYSQPGKIPATANERPTPARSTCSAASYQRAHHASTANTILRRSVRSASPVRPARTPVQPPSNRPFPSSHTSVSGILGQKTGPFSDVAATSRPKFSSRASTRAASPARSLSSWGGRTRSPARATDPAPTLSEEGGRGRLWNELRQIQRRSRPPTERSPSP
jgi:protein SFI1